jgi:hypothetical protein
LISVAPGRENGVGGAWEIAQSVSAARVDTLIA